MVLFQHMRLGPFLKDHLRQLPRKGRGEGTRMARFLGVSTTLVSQVLAGEKLFTVEQGQRMCTYLGLNETESDYLIFMLNHERAGTHELKAYWQAKLAKLREQAVKVVNRVQAKRVLSNDECAVFYSTPIYTAVRLYTSVGGRGKSQAEIMERFGLSRARTANILDFLTETNLCYQEDGRYFMGSQSTHLEQGSAYILRHQTNWRIRAIRQNEELTDEELMYTATISLSRTDFARLREEMVVFIKQFLDKVHASPAEEIACLNLDFFWIRR